MITSHKAELPSSPTRIWITLIGLSVATGIFFILRPYVKVTVLQITLSLIGSLVLTVVSLEMIFLKSYRRSSTGLDFSSPQPRQWGQIFTRLIGLYATLLLVGFCYWLFLEYRDDGMKFYFIFVKYYAVPALTIGSIPYFIWLDRYQVDRQDGFYHMGCLVLYRLKQVQRGELKQHLLSWMVKAFFLPIMFFSLAKNINMFLVVEQLPQSNKEWYFFVHNLLFTFDLLLAATGYMCTFKLIDSHVRSTEPTFWGWFVALFCYEPFYLFFQQHYLGQPKSNHWMIWLEAKPTIFAIWGGAILILISIYLWATLSFGIRFSNLTHRGIFTNGAYRFTKHPAYVAKNIAWWLIEVPFIAGGTPLESFRLCSLLAILTLFYFFRARTEERHLSKDPVYVEYALAMNQHSVFAWFGRIFPIFQYRAPVVANNGSTTDHPV